MRHGLAIIAFGLTVQLVEHVCHYGDTLVAVVAKSTDYERGDQLIMGKESQQQDCWVSVGAESKTGLAYLAACSWWWGR